MKGVRYMYEDGKKSLSLNWGSLAIKLVILAVIVFIAGWIFVKVTGNSSTKSSNTLADSNSEYINNINTMKTAAFEYFTKSKLPEKVGTTEKVTLAQMINQKLLIDFTNDGKTCDNNSSYIQTTKTADGNYALKVSLTCGKQSDFIVTTIEKTSCDNGTCTVDNTKTNTDVVDNNNNNNNNSNNTNSNTNKSNSNTNNNTNSNNSSNNTNTSKGNSSSTSTSTKTTVTTKVTIKITCSNGCCQTNCNNNNNNNNNNNDNNKPNPTPTKVRYYKYVKYSDWENGYSNASNAENKKQLVETNNYCKEYEKTYYSTGYVTDTTKVGKYNYEVQFLDLPSDVNSVAIVGNSKSYFSNSNTDYQAYINNRGNLYMTGNTGKYNVAINNASTFRNTSLKKNNFTFEVSGAYYNRAEGNYATTITINYKNLNGVSPYYASNLSQNVYFVPLKFDVSYTRESKCKWDLASNASKYEDYAIIDTDTEYTWTHRTFEYKWSKEKSLAGYTYTGEYEDRAE